MKIKNKRMPQVNYTGISKMFSWIINCLVEEAMRMWRKEKDQSRVFLLILD